MIKKIWSNYVWRNPQLDALAFEVPEHQGAPLDVARQVYHRLVLRLAAMNAYRRQWQVMFVAAGLWALSLILPKPEQWVLWSGWGFIGSFVLGVWMVPRLMRGTVDQAARKEAAGVVRRCFLREVEETTPEDLRDVWRHGWLTSDGRPVSSEISEADARAGVSHSVALWWFASIFAFAASVACLLGHLSSFPWLIGPFVLKLIFDRNPAHDREQELSAQEGAEGLAFVSAGGKAWALRQEGARRKQLENAERDAKDKPDGNLIELGRATGLLATRGDLYAPSDGLPFCASLRDLQTHLLVLGGTGSGKTTAVLKPLIYQAAAWEGVGLLVMDGKGALPGELKRLRGSLKVINPKKAKVSLVAGVEPGVVVDTLIGILGGQSSDRFWSDSAAGLLRRAALVAFAVGEGSWTLMEAAQIAFDGEAAREAIAALDSTKLIENPELAEAVAYLAAFFDPESQETKLRDNIIAQARSWITTLTAHPHILAWANTKPEDSEIDILGVLRGEKIGILIPAHRYGPAGAVATALLKARVYGALKERADADDDDGNAGAAAWRACGETPVLMVVDEAQEVATEEDGTMLAIGRSLGLAFVAATQTIEGVHERLGRSAPKWLGIFGGVVALAGRSPDTDQFVAQRIGSCWMPHLSGAAGMPVRVAMHADMMTGPHAAKLHQKLFAKNFEPKNWTALLSRATRGVGVALRAVSAGGALGQAQSQLGPRHLVEPAEVQTLLAEPNTALAIVSRARVIRRDVVTLLPAYD